MTAVTLAETFVHFLDRHNFEYRGPTRGIPGRHIHYVDLSSLRLRFSDYSPMIEVASEEAVRGSVEEITAGVVEVILKLQYQDRLPIVLLAASGALADEVRQLANQPPYYYVVLDAIDMEQIMLSKSVRHDLLRRIRWQVPLKSLSPYEESAPVTGSQFFGRETEIRQMLAHSKTCFTVIGGERIGKTSLLKEVQRRLIASDSDSADYIKYMDCTLVKSNQHFFELLTDRVSSGDFYRLYEKSWRTGARYMEYFPEFVRMLRKRAKKPVTFLLDEFDFAIKVDRDERYEIINTLRACYMEDSCRLIFAGVREVSSEVAANKAPFNFTTPLRLSTLSPDGVAELVGLPLESMGVRLHNKDRVIRQLYEATRGHPNYLQYCCVALLGQLDLKGSRELAPEDVEQITNDANLRSRIYDIFAKSASDLEKAVALALATLSQFTLAEAMKELKLRGIPIRVNELEGAFKNLRGLAILEDRGDTFRFTIPLFAQFLLNRYKGMERSLCSEAREYIYLHRQQTG